MKTQNIRLSSFIQVPSLFNFYFDSIYMTLAQLDGEYPFFTDWFYKKVKNGLLNGERDIIFNEIDNYISGLVILKNNAQEKKICTLRVVDRFQKMGLGTSLMQDSFEYLQTEKPLITVNSLKERQFKHLFSHFGFERTYEYKNFYHCGLNEISFNGCLDSSHSSYGIYQ